MTSQVYTEALRGYPKAFMARSSLFNCRSHSLHRTITRLGSNLLI